MADRLDFPDVAAAYAHYGGREGWPWPRFLPHELACRGTGIVIVVPRFLDWMMLVRTAFGHPMIVSSWGRHPEHDRRVSTSTNPGAGPHTTGEAADVRVYGAWTLELLDIVTEDGVRGLGIHQRGPAGQRFLHLDLLPDGLSGPRPWVWTY